jgi:hypothetical protein
MSNQVLSPGPYDTEDENGYGHPDIGPGHDAPAGKSYDPRGHDVAAGDPSDPRGDGLDSVRRGEESPSEGSSGSLFNASGDKGTGKNSSAAADPTTLFNAEASPKATSLDGTNVGNLAGRAINLLWGNSKRRRNTITGSIIGLLVGGGIFGMTIVSGPLEFIHIAQLLEKFHFSKQEDAENNRLEKIVRYLKDPEKPERTRMGLVGNALADKLEAKMHDATGLSSDYENGSFKGYVADPEHENFKGKSPDEMKAIMAEELGVDASSIDIVTKNGVKVPRFNPDTGGLNSIKNYRNQVGTARALFTEAGFNNVSAHVSARVLKTRAGWTFHPIKKLDSAYQEKLFAGGKAALDKLKEQFNTQEEEFVAGDTAAPPVPGESGTETDGNGNPVSDPSRAAAADAGSTVESDPSEGTIKAKLAGGGAALVGVLCVMNGINDKVGDLRKAKVELPMMRLAGQFISIGSQAQSGQDIDMTQLGLYKQFLDGTNSQGQSTTWNGARSIEYELGQPQNGPDLPKGAQVFNAGKPFAFIDNLNPALSTACGILGSPIGFFGGLVLAPITTLFQQFIIGPDLLDPLVADTAGWLSGAPINIMKGAGAVDGNYINYGARLAANQQFASAGGVQLSPGQEVALKDTTNAVDNAAFQSKSIAYRIFNPSDDQTLVSKVVDSYGNRSTMQGFASLVTGFSNIFTSTIKSVVSLFSGVAHTSAAQPYDYHGLKAVGFTADDLGNQAYDNPFKNACAVTGGQGCQNATGILGDPNSPNQTYIDRVQKCFGDTITPNGGNWDLSFTSNQPVDMESDDYKGANCGDSDPNWTRVRFWIIDTQTIEAYDCYSSDTSTADQSCQDVGDSSNSSSGTSTTPTTGGGGSYQNPFPGGWTPNRLDMGYDGTFKGQIVAPFSGTITYASNSFSNWGGYMEIKADQQPNGLPTSTLYFAEGIKPIVTSGHVNAGTPIADPAPSPYGNAYGTDPGGNGEIEWGVAADGSSVTDPYAEAALAAAKCPAATSQSRSMVLNFAQWVQQNLHVAPPAETGDAGCA